MSKKILVFIGVLAVLMLVSSVIAIPIPGANKNAPQMVPVYDQGGKLVSYVLDNSVPAPILKNGKPAWYLQTINQGSGYYSYYEADPITGFNTPYPATWDQSLTKFTYLQYIEYCQKYGLPKRGTFAVNLITGGWMK